MAQMPLATDRQYTVKELRDEHFEILRLKIAGFKNVDIAQRLGITPNTVCNVLSSPVAKAHLKELQENADAQTVDLVKQIDRMMPHALGLLEAVLKGPKFPREGAEDENWTQFEQEEITAPLPLRVNVAQDLVNKSINARGPKTSSGLISLEDIEKLKQRCKKVKIGVAVEVSDEDDGNGKGE